MEYTQTELEDDRNLSLFKSGVKDSDIIFFQGGGNLNDMYLKAEIIRRKIISEFPMNKIVIFPQSISFGNSTESTEIKNHTSKIYGSHRNLTICTRDQTSYAIAKQIFPQNKVLLFPDMAIFLIGSFNKNHNKTDKIALCFRDDREKLYSDNELDKAISSLKHDYLCEKIDTHVGHAVLKANRESEIAKMIENFSSYKLVITDRFHGVIYSAIAGTPCIALKSTDHKIVDGIKWLEDFKNIEYAALSDVPTVAKKLLSQTHTDEISFNTHFSKMAKIVFENEIFPPNPLDNN